MDIVHVLELNTSAEKAYQALTTEEGINGWWSKDCDMPVAEGEALSVRFMEQQVEMGFQLETLQPFKAVSWLATKNPNPAFLGTRIDFRISPKGNGVELCMNHSGWDKKWEGKPNYERSRDTWGHFMTSLKGYLETGEGQPW